MKLAKTCRSILIFASLIFLISLPSIAQTPKATPPVSDEDQVIKVSSRLVVIPVSVIDASGEPVLGLKAESFQVTEENRPQEIDSVGDAENVPLEIALLIDVSGSVNALFDLEKHAAAQFLQTVMRPDDRATIFLIGDKPISALERNSAEQAAQRVREIVPSGKFTAFYDTVSAASRYLRQNAPLKSRRVIVALTDGEDNWSDLVRNQEKAAYTNVDVSKLDTNMRNHLAATTDNAHKNAQAKISRDLQDADTVFYVINPAGTSLQLNKVSIRAQVGLEKFANETGGTAFLPAFQPTATTDQFQNASNAKKNAAVLDKIFKQLANELRAQYLVQYYSEAEFPSNKYVKLSVGVKNGAAYRVRARQGYYSKSQ
jgi:Ca-activated chloride channel family protein